MSGIDFVKGGAVDFFLGQLGNLLTEVENVGYTIKIF